MKIAAADVIVSSPDRNFVTLKITTDDGLTGLGDATLNGRELAVVAYLRDHVVPLLIGRDARRIEDTWQFLYRRAYWRRGPVTMAAIAAVDVALWDIKAQGRRHAALPAARRRVAATGLMAYGHASGETSHGAVRLDPRTTRSWATGPSASRRGVPGIEAIYGIASQRRAAIARSATTTSPRNAGRCPPRRTGTPPPTCATSRRCSRRCATSSGPSCRCSTTGTTG